MYVTVVTLTGGRPEAFALCERWMRRQDYSRWVVVDDCEPITGSALPDVWVRPRPVWDGENTVHRNLLAALPHLKGRVVVVEDDDYYPPGYVQRMARELDKSPLVGMIPAPCYSVHYGYMEYGNEEHASLAQTAFREELIPRLKQICEAGEFVDMALWKTGGRLIPNDGFLSIKGLPGRPGYMQQHRKLDPRFRAKELHSLIGSDSEHYKRFLNHHPV